MCFFLKICGICQIRSHFIKKESNFFIQIMSISCISYERSLIYKYEVKKMSERLQKVIARSGIASRRKAEELMLNGKVTANGQVIRTLGYKVKPSDAIEVEGIPLTQEEKVYFLFYKPAGVITSASDDKGRKTVLDFFPHVKERIFPIGRLDYQTSGLLLITNDGELANLITHPRYGIDKSYIVKIKGYLTKEQVKQLQRGIMLEDGKTLPARVKVKSYDRKRNTSIVHIVIWEGRNRQVRRMFEAIGFRVEKLKREQLSFLTLGYLNPGEYRVLTAHEIKQLRVVATTKDHRLDYMQK